MHDEKILSQSQEKLLLKWLDCECNWLEKWRVRHLLNGSQDARSFIRQMETLEEETRDFSRSLCSCEAVDLWDKVSRRIEQEERTELMLGRRMTGKASPSLTLVGALGWSLSGAAVAATVVLGLLFQFSPSSRPDMGRETVAERPQALKFVSNESRSRHTGDEFGGGLDFDWVHSKGRVQLIHDPGNRSAIIWVRRRSGPARSYVQPTAAQNEVLLVNGEKRRVTAPGR